MKRIELEVLSDAVNNWIVRTPGREFPGVIIQGDSLHSLRGRARTLLELARKHADEELVDVAQELVDILEERVTDYESVVRAKGLELPYPS